MNITTECPLKLKQAQVTDLLTVFFSVCPYQSSDSKLLHMLFHEFVSIGSIFILFPTGQNV